MRRLVLFDIDGTILWSDGAGRSAIRRALVDELGIVKAFERIPFDGKTDRQIVREILEAADHPEPESAAHIEAVCDRYLGLLSDELSARRAHMRVFPGVRELLDDLEERDGVVVGLLTGNLEQGAHLKLGAAGFEPDRFTVGAFGSDAAHRPDLPAIAVRRTQERHGWTPDGRQVVIIGDTPADMTCGNGIGARAVGVATGSFSVEALQEAGADAVFETLESVGEVVEAILA